MTPPLKLDPHKNQITRALPDEESKNLWPHLLLVSGNLGDVVFEACDSVRYIYLPQRAVVSIVAHIENGHGGEAALIGLEGLAGVRAAMESNANRHKAVAQVPGELLKVKGVCSEPN